MKKISGKRNSFRIRPICAAVLLAVSMQAAQANPIGASVINGQAGFNSSGNTLTVTNTPGTIIHWQDFSIGTNEITRFVQQNAASTVLNRVVSSNPSNILGSLQSNGRVFLVNPNGILFGAGATVDLTGLVASTLNINNEDFLAGRQRYTEVPSAQKIRNAGSINAQSGGHIYLIAPDVENTGVITAPNGEILLVAGQSAELVDSSEPSLRVNITAPAGDATNVGQLLAEAGSLGLYGTIVRNTGAVSADSATMQGGKIVFKASQRAEVSGTVSANGVTGGTIEVLGNQAGIMDGARLSADGAQGGGTILVGGDYQGKNPEVQNAQVTYVAPSATISADATDNGDGGKVIVWADDTTRYYGSISARGGANGGDGGFVETSGKNFLSFNGVVDTSATNGEAGNLLLDPANIWIALNQANATAAGMPGTDASADASGPTTFQAAGAPTDSLLTTFTLQTALGSNNVIVTNGGSTGGSGEVNFVDPVTWASTNTLTVNAAGSIFINAALTGSNARIELITPLGIQQTAAGIITASGLLVDADDDVLLNQANLVTNFAADMNTTGILTFFNDQSMIISTVGSSSGINFSNNSSSIHIKTTANLIINQPVSSSPMGGGEIKLEAQNGLFLNAAVTSSFNSDPGGPVILIAGPGGVSSSGGAITASQIEVISGGNVALNDANLLQAVAGAPGTLAGTSSGGFSFNNTNPGGFIVGTVNTTVGLTDTSGNITLTSADQDSLLTIAQPVTATTGSVSYIADNINLVSTTTANTAGKFVEIKPFTAATNFEFQIPTSPDAAGFLRLTSGELGNITTQLLKVGNTSMTGGITVNQAVAPANFTSMSLITSGAITQAAGITIASLNADGAGGVTLNNINNDVDNLSGHANGNNNFEFTDSVGLNIAQVDAGGPNGINITGGTTGRILLTAGGNITQSAGANLVAPGLGVNNSVGNITLNNAGNGVGIFAGDSTLGSISYVNSGNLQIGTVGVITGITVTEPSTAIKVQTTGGLTINTGTGNEVISSGTGGEIILSGTSFINNLGSTALQALGRWLVYSVNPASDTRNGLVYDFKQYNLAYTGSAYAGPGVGDGFIYSVAPVLTASLVGGPITKTYDGNTSVALNASNFSFAGALDSDTIAYAGATGSTYNNKNVGTGKTVTASGITVTATNGVANVYGYSSSNASANIGRINPKTLTTSGAVAQDKIYDGTTAATITTSLVGVIGGDVVTHDGAGVFADPNVGTSIPVTALLGLTGTGAGNYILVQPRGLFADITPAALTVITGNLTGTVSKIYDGTDIATLTQANYLLNGFVGGDGATVTQTTGVYDSRHVGSDKTVTVNLSTSDFQPTGSTLLSNYTLPTSASGNIGTIIVRPLSIWTGLGGDSLWSNPLNWDALPDGNNVLAVLIPSGSVNMDGAVALPTLTNAGNMSMNGNDLSLGNFILTGGSLSGDGNLNVTDSFSQTGGTISLNGAAIANITQDTGNLNIDNLSAPTANLTASSGAITQSGAILAGTLNTHSATGTTLTDNGNQIANFSASNSGVGNILLINTFSPLTLNATTNPGGNVMIENTGGIIVDGVLDLSGNFVMIAHSPITINSNASITSVGSLSLTAGAAASPVLTDIITINGTLSGSSITLAANSVVGNIPAGALLLTPSGGGSVVGGLQGEVVLIATDGTVVIPTSETEEEKKNGFEVVVVEEKQGDNSAMEASLPVCRQ